MANFRDLNEALEAIRGKAIETSQGSFIKLEDLEELLTQFKESKVETRIPNAPRSFDAAKRMAKQDPNLQEHFRQPDEATREAFRGTSTPIASEGR